MRLLEQKVAERTRELTTLLDDLEHRRVDAGAEVACSPSCWPRSRAARLHGRHHPAASTAASWSSSITAGRSPPSRSNTRASRRSGRIDCAELRRDSPLIIDNVWDDSPAAKAFRASAPSAMTLLFGYARSLLVVPLKARDRLIGVLIDRQRATRAVRPARSPSWPGRWPTRPRSPSRTRASTIRRASWPRSRSGSGWRASCTTRSPRACTPRRCWGSRCRRRGSAIPAGPQMLAHLRDVTTSALAELRTLLIELRPSVALQVELGELLRQLARALRSRIEMPIDVDRRRHGRAAGRGAGDLLPRGAGGAGQHRQARRHRARAGHACAARRSPRR